MTDRNRENWSPTKLPISAIRKNVKVIIAWSFDFQLQLNVQWIYCLQGFSFQSFKGRWTNVLFDLSSFNCNLMCNKFTVCKDSGRMNKCALRYESISPVQTDVTLLASQQPPTLLDVTFCVRLHTLLHAVTCCWELLRKVWNRSNFLLRANGRNNSQRSLCTDVPPPSVHRLLPTPLRVVASVCT